MVSHDKVGDVLVAQGDTAGALAAYRASLAIAERLAAADPGNAGWQRDLAVSHNKVGDVLLAQGDAAGALAAYRASLAIAERLAAADPANADWQRDLAVSHSKVGDVLLAQGDLAGALAAYRASLAIAERLAAADPANAEWQRDLARSHIKVGDVLLAQGDTGRARWPRIGRAWRSASGWRPRTLPTPNGSATWRSATRRSATCCGRRGMARPRWPHIGRAWPSPSGWRPRTPPTPAGSTTWRSATARWATCCWRRGIPAGALAAYRASLAIAERLAAAVPGNADLQRGLCLLFLKTAAASGSAGERVVREYLQRAFDTLSAMKRAGLTTSPADEQVYQELRQTLRR